MTSVLYFLLTLLILVAVHEYGHFAVARLCGVKVLRFSIGFGRALWRWKDRSGTEFVLAAIPLGGYVQMLDEREQTVSPEEKQYSFNQKSIIRRVAIVSAGPIANFILAVLLFWIIFVVGVQGVAPVVGKIESDSPAYRAGIETGQKIVSVDGDEVVSRSDVNDLLVRRMGDSGHIVLQLQSAGSNVASEAIIPIEQWLASQKSPNPYADLGFRFFQPQAEPIVDAVVDGYGASLAGMLAGDRIISIDAQPVQYWLDIEPLVRSNAGQRVTVEVLRKEQRISLVVDVGAVEVDGETVGRIGIQGRPREFPEDMLVLQQSGVVGGLQRATKTTYDMVGTLFGWVGKLVTGSVSGTNLGGPLSIAKMASASAEYGITPYLKFLAMLSISLGVLNLLPIPVLDGGQLVFLAAEALRGKPLSDSIQLWAQQAGLFIILGIMMFAIYNDITRL